GAEHVHRASRALGDGRSDADARVAPRFDGGPTLRLAHPAPLANGRGWRLDASAYLWLVCHGFKRWLAPSTRVHVRLGTFDNPSVCQRVSDQCAEGACGDGSWPRLSEGDGRAGGIADAGFGSGGDAACRVRHSADPGRMGDQAGGMTALVELIVQRAA